MTRDRGWDRVMRIIKIGLTYAVMRVRARVTPVLIVFLSMYDGVGCPARPVGSFDGR
jgi:hypothetical protein